MKHTLITLLILSIFSCKEEQVFLDIPDYARPHYDQFFTEARERGVNISQETLFFKGKTTEEMDGRLAYSWIAEKTISVDTARFIQLKHFGQEYVIFHELGHYLLRRPHVYIKLEDGTPQTIMDALEWAYSDSKRLEMRDYYLDELFSNWK